MPDVLRGVGIEQRLQAQSPLELVFRDDTGRQVQLGDYFGAKPVILRWRITTVQTCVRWY